MKRRLDTVSMPNFLAVIDEALARSGRTRADIGYLNLLHMKRSAHRAILEALGLREDQSCYLSDLGHVGQQDQMFLIRRGLEPGRLRDADLMVMAAAGIGYAWAAAWVAWGEPRRGCVFPDRKVWQNSAFPFPNPSPPGEAVRRLPPTGRGWEGCGKARNIRRNADAEQGPDTGTRLWKCISVTGSAGVPG
jgi:hypothetical protein